MGMPRHSTLMIQGSINSTMVSILIDCGSTHNFIADSVVPKIGLSTYKVIPFGVRIGNGDIIRCNSVCKHVLLHLNDLQITQEFYPFSLGGAEVILGIQWLATLDTVQANWKDMFLRFTTNGKDYTLHGSSSDFKLPATLCHLTIEPLEMHTRLEDKSFLRAGSIDTNPRVIQTGSRK